MDVLWQGAALCAVFTLLILPSQFKNPLSQIASYPSAIRKRVEGLPQYRGMYRSERKRNIVRKTVGSLIAVVLFACLSIVSGKTTFVSSFVHVFILFQVVNLYDLLIFDFVIFPHSKRLRIPGTEDMTDEYKDPVHHIKGAGKGVLIGTVIAVLSACVVEIIMRIGFVG